MTSECTFTKDVCLDKDGYPRVKWQKKMWRLNRLIYTFVNGAIPEGKVVGHKCNNKGCINPNHLYLTTFEENSSHAARDGLYRTGENHPKSKLNLEKAGEIREMYATGEFSQQYLAYYFGVSQSVISEVILNKKWKER